MDILKNMHSATMGKDDPEGWRKRNSELAAIEFITFAVFIKLVRATSGAAMAATKK